MEKSRHLARIGMALFLAGGILGFWILNLQGEEYFERSGMLSEYFIRQYKYLEVDGAFLFYYILEQKGIWMLLIWMLGATAVGAAAAWMFCGWLGILAGILIGLGIFRFGVSGILFCLCAMIPQCFFYVPAWVLLIRGALKKWAGRKKKSFSIRALDWRYGGLFAFSFGLFLLGILTESYINPWLMKQILRFF